MTVFFLFQLNDILLYTTPVSGGYRLNQAIPLTGMKVGNEINLASFCYIKHKCIISLYYKLLS